MNKIITFQEIKCMRRKTFHELIINYLLASVGSSLLNSFAIFWCFFADFQEYVGKESNRRNNVYSTLTKKMFMLYIVTKKFNKKWRNKKMFAL